MGRVSRASPDKHTIGDEDVEVDVEIQRAAEALDSGDRPALDPWQSACLRDPAEVAEDGSEHNGEDVLAEVIVPGEPEPERDGQGEHPLTNRDAGQDALAPPQRVLGHPSATAPGAEAPPLTGEADDSVESTAGAGGAGEASREVSAADQLPQFSEDEARQRLTGLLTALYNRLQVLRQQRR
jgi:hypothetical protein